MNSINKIEEYIDKNFSDKRRTHTYGVRKTALHLAEKYGCDLYKTEVAALLHDLYRGAGEDVLNYYVRHLGLDKKYLNNPNLAHGPVAAEMITKDFGVDDKEIIDAVRYHTTGRPCMTMLDKIIYIADATEPGRSYPGVEELRREAESDIDKACLDSLKKTIDFVASEGNFLDRLTVEAEKYLEEKINKKEKSDDK